jgi:hypothetical protein
MFMGLSPTQCTLGLDESIIGPAKPSVVGCQPAAKANSSMTSENATIMTTVDALHVGTHATIALTIWPPETIGTITDMAYFILRSKQS